MNNKRTYLPDELDIQIPEIFTDTVSTQMRPRRLHIVDESDEFDQVEESEISEKRSPTANHNKGDANNFKDEDEEIEQKYEQTSPRKV